MRRRAGCAWCGADAGRVAVRPRTGRSSRYSVHALKSLDIEHLKMLLGSGASEIARLIPEIKLSLPSLEEAKAATDSESARFRLFDAVATLLKNVARNGPLLIVIDDLHDADQPSLQMLRFVARETKDERILVVGTYRDVEVRQSPELGKLIGDLIREGRTVSIAGLSQAEVGEFIERSSAKKADDKLVVDLYHATDGNPLFVDGVVRLLAAEGKLARTGFDGSAFKIPRRSEGIDSTATCCAFGRSELVVVDRVGDRE